MYFEQIECKGFSIRMKCCYCNKATKTSDSNLENKVRS